MEGTAGTASPRSTTTPAALRAERWAELLHPHRTTLLTGGLGAFVVGLLPLAAVVHGLAPFARWHTAVFAASVPIVLWALGLVVLATFFHPTQGLVGSRVRAPLFRPRWMQALLRAYAALTVWAFGVSPVVVLGAAVV